MADVIDFDAARRRAGKPAHPIVEALDALALALADHDHHWSDRERSLYETAIDYFEGQKP